ncbi:arylsulfatase [Colwellia sp. UCD-KL20]|uniref:arylsulfatase n=1 Tax=Colwellia sp. UCD-KL20 TaxID=1917165 RepID=UPI00097103CE|nr:arylsulfatase [Colwellia sp. UCD-KL20]
MKRNKIKLKKNFKRSLAFLVISSLITTIISGCNSPNTNLNNSKQLTSSQANKQPNIVLIVTDDQGWGDIGINNNPIIQTPNIDDLANQSVSLTNFHVDPTCSPTRSALLTGKHSLKAGVWHTILGRYMLGPEHQTLAEVLKDNNYDTGIFGKWHLGDNYPYRPQDQGFNEVLIHGGGGVGQTPDYWGNTQFNDTYFRNGNPEKTTGYATTVWFNEAKKFIDQKRNQPYFAYIPLNAPHGPYRAPENFIQPYLDKGLNRTMASFYGMITHIDGQIGLMRKHIKARGETDNTIFIVMTDNGSSYRPTNNQNKLDAKHQLIKQAFPDWIPNDNLRGYKGSVYDGGHRVPFFISYPNGQLKAGKYNNLTAHFDIMPTILSLAGIENTIKGMDGLNLATLITEGKDDTLSDRNVVITNQRVYHPSDKRPTAVAYKNWRFINENNKEELYNIATDPSQQINVAQQHPNVLAQLKSIKQAWWNENVKLGFKDRYISVGNKAENPVRLNAMDWMEVPDKQPVPWFIGHQPAAEEYDYIHWLTEEDKYTSLPWYIDVEKKGTYQISAYFHDIPAGTPIGKKYCVVRVNGKNTVQTVHGRASHCIVNTKLITGKQKITAWFTDNKETLAKEKAAFYVYIKHQK